MGPSYSILGVLFLGGLLLFLLIILMLAASTKGGGGLSGRPVAASLLFAVAILLMATPAVMLTFSSTYSNEHAFRMFFGRQPGENIRFLNNASGGGADHSIIMLSFELGRERRIETFAAAAHLKLSASGAIPEVRSEKPVWWKPEDCPSQPSIFAAAPDNNWQEKWAAYCPDTRIVHAYAHWTQ